MEGSKLITLLETFSSKELRRFKEFLESPYFNKRTDLIHFYEYLVTIVPTHEIPCKEEVFSTLFPEKEYDDKYMRYLMNYTLQMVEAFLGYESQSATANDFSILKELVNRKLDKHARKYFSKLEKRQKSLLRKSPEGYYEGYQLAMIKNLHFNNQGERREDRSIQHSSESLDVFYLVKKLKYSCEMLSRQRVFSTQYNLEISDLLYRYLINHAVYQEPMIAIYLQVYATFVEEASNRHFEELKQLIHQYADKVPVSEIRDIYFYAINYCTYQIGQKVDGEYYSNECLNLYVEGIQKRYLYTNGFLSPWTFKNTVKLGFNLEKYDWVEQFIQQYYKDLAPEFQQGALHYNLADLFYRKKMYGESKEHLQKVEHSDPFDALGARVMLLKIYYENGDFDPLFSLIASFSIYVRRNKKISSNYRDAYLNFATLLHQVIRATPDKLPAIQTRIKETQPLTNRSWLLKICAKS